MTKFQSYLLAHFGIDANTSATLIITLFVFAAGIFLQWFLGAMTGAISRRQTRQIFIGSLKDLETQISKQAKAYKKTSLTLTFDKKANFEFSKATITGVSSIQNLGYEKTYHAFFFGIENWLRCNNEKRLKAFGKIWDAVESVEFWHNKSFQDIDPFLERINQINKRRNSAIESHRKFFEPIITDLDGKEVPSEFGKYIQAVDKIHVDWQNQPNRSRPDVIHRQLVLRLRILNRKNIKFPVANRMNDNLLAASMEYENQSKELRAQRAQFESYYKAFLAYEKTCRKHGEILN